MPVTPARLAHPDWSPDGRLLAYIEDRRVLFGVGGPPPELMLRAKDLASMSFLPLHAYLLAGLIYFLMAFPLSLMTKRVERRFRRGLRSVTA